MNYRDKEIKKLGIEVRWLDKEHSNHAYDFAIKFSNDNYYGLDENNVTNIKRHKVYGCSVADNWLKKNIESSGTVQIVYSNNEVCVINTDAFLNNWQRIFMPSRDDAIILHNLSSKIIFYYHEHELEVGERNA